jgi:hypothetical protein
MPTTEASTKQPAAIPEQLFLGSSMRGSVSAARLTGGDHLSARAHMVWKMKNLDSNKSKSPSQLITERIAELGDWRGETLAHIRKLIEEADPNIMEEWKWRGVPVWSDNGIICTGESYKTVVKLTFLKGASIEDPAALFNASLEGNTRRAIDLHEGSKIDESAFKELIRAAVKLNAKGKK